MLKNLTSHVLAILALSATQTGAFAQSSGSITSTIPAAKDVAYAGTIALDVDATDLDHRVFRVRQQMPVKPGALTKGEQHCKTD